MSRHARLLLVAILVFTAALAAACGGSGDGGDKLVVYSGREQELVEPLFAQFTEDTGIELDVRYGGSPELAATLREEGDATPAQVFYAQDAGSIGVLEPQLGQLPQADLDLIPAEFRDPDGRWVGVTGRVRTMIFNTDRVQESQLPQSVMDVASPDWKLGTVGVAPTNASFVGFVSAMRVVLGDAKTEEFLRGLATHAKTYEKNSQIADAVASGEIDTGLVNHYYLYEKLASDPNAPVANHYFDPADVGSFVNVSAVGILKAAQDDANAQRFVNYLLTTGQAFFADGAEEREYPLNATASGTEKAKELPPLDEHRGPKVPLAELGLDLDSTVQMIRDAGLVD